MKNIEINVDKKNVEIKFTIKGDDWKEVINKTKKELINNIEIKGFRKGKVPVDIAEKNISNQEIQNKSINKVIDKNYDEIISNFKDHKIISQPKINLEKVSDDELVLIFKASLFPKINLGNFENLKISYKEEKVSEKDVEEQLEKINDLFKEKVELKDKDHKIVVDDIVNIDFSGTVDGKSFDGGSANNYELKIGSNSFVDNFEDQLIGLKVNESKNVKVTFPSTYPEEKLKNKIAIFNVKINKVLIEEKFSDEKLTQKLTSLGYKSIQDFKEKIKIMLNEQNSHKADDVFFQDFLKELKKMKETEIDIPFELLNQELDREFDDFKNNLLSQGMKIKDYFEMLNTDEDRFKEKNLKPNVQNRLENSLIYSKLIEDLKIKITEEDLDKEYNRISKQQNIKLEDIKKQIPEETVRNSLMYQKLISKLK